METNNKTNKTMKQKTLNEKYLEYLISQQATALIETAYRIEGCYTDIKGQVDDGNFNGLNRMKEYTVNLLYKYQTQHDRLIRLLDNSSSKSKTAILDTVKEMTEELASYYEYIFE